MTIAKYAYTALDCPDPIALADFYSKITGWPVEPLGDFPPSDVTWLELLDSNGDTKMGFQKIDNYTAPTWPEGNVPQQVHMDFHAIDLDETEAKLLAIGARKADHQVHPDRFRVYLDPIGHPFCIVKKDSL
jgi:hypothetical protein